MNQSVDIIKVVNKDGQECRISLDQTTKNTPLLFDNYNGEPKSIVELPKQITITEDFTLVSETLADRFTLFSKIESQIDGTKGWIYHDALTKNMILVPDLNISSELIEHMINIKISAVTIASNVKVAPAQQKASSCILYGARDYRGCPNNYRKTLSNGTVTDVSVQEVYGLVEMTGASAVKFVPVINTHGSSNHGVEQDTVTAIATKLWISL